MKQKEVIDAGGGWKKITPQQFICSPFTRIGKEWMLITAGNVQNDKHNWNTMTASWGGLGVLWAKDVAFAFIRPSRQTFTFADSASVITLSFFDESWRRSLNICGSKSGRDTDKAAAGGLTPVVFNDIPCAGTGSGAGSAVSFMEARDVLVCRKLYIHDIDPGKFLDTSIEKHYSGADYHRMFVLEVIDIRTKN
ncbi:MAG: flavin reductase family protein [Treponema sp.]|nr:flavin reductase family protein [Treponema sp.]